MKADRSGQRTMALAIWMTAMLLVTPLLAWAPGAHAEDATQAASAVTPQEAKSSVLKGLAWLATQQAADGSWSTTDGMAGLAAIAYEAAGFDHINATVQRGLGYIRSFYNATTGTAFNGFFFYEQAISLMALLASGDPQDSGKIPGIQSYLTSLQYQASELNTSTQVWLGGMAGSGGSPDLSTGQFYVLGLQSCLLQRPEITIPAGFWDGILTYTAKCQNWPAVNPLDWAHNASHASYNDGGFVYNHYRGRTPAGMAAMESYGSISAAGLYIYLMAGHGYQFPETSAALEWSNHEFSTEGNPRMEGRGTYYYLWTLARALAMSGQDFVVDGAGKTHDWRSEIADHLIGLQLADGGWPGSSVSGWREEERVLASIYSILALETAFLTAPCPTFELEVSGATGARFVGLDGGALATDVARGLTVTPTELTCTDPETFRKVWIDIKGTDGATASVRAKGTWGQGRTAWSNLTVTIGAHGARVFSGTGGFAGPFGIFLTAMSGGPLLKTDLGKRLELVRGKTTIVDVNIEETTDVSNVTGLDVIAILPEGASVDVDSQHVNVSSGGVSAVELTVFVPANATKGSVGRLVFTSNNAMPIYVPVSYIDETSDIAPSSTYWALILFLFVVVVALIALPGMRRKSKEEGKPQP